MIKYSINFFCSYLKKKVCLFTKNSNFIKIDNNYLLMDDNYNIHIVDASGHFSVFNYK